jgi:anaerobic dimethyl sulfoxide reductase subunit C (anchor subunit)
LRNQDWSLVIFTSFAQASVGIILCFTLLTFFCADSGLFIETGLSLKNPVLLALVFIGVATVVSFLHLGNPTNAPNALNNLSGSWLSREILALGAYTACLLIVFVLGWQHGAIRYPGYLLPLSSVAGIAFLWMMIRIYVIPTIPAWNSWNTPLSFVSTTICLGLLTFLVLHYFRAIIIDDQIVYNLVVSLIVVLCTEIASGFVHQSQLQKMDGGVDDLVFNRGSYYRVFLFRTGVLIVAVMAMFIVILKPALVLENNDNIWLYPVLALIITQEIMGRLLFYSSYFRLGV